MKLADNEFYILKIIGKADAYYGDGNNSLRGVKLYKTLKKALEAQEEAKRYFKMSTQIVLLTMNISSV